ncbi:MAG: trigger factor [Clostridia bacterium]|nr:trigger factor [Clostridia bacterium]
MSLVSSNKVDTNRHEFEVSVDGESFKKAINTVYKKQVKNINIPGFRKGKAPKSVIEKMYGKEVFYEDAMQDLYPKALQDAIEEAGVRIVNDKIDLDVTEVSEDGFTFKAVVTTYPEIAIDGYKGIEIEAVSAEVTEEKINEEIDKARQRASSIAEVEDRPAQDGDITVIDFEGFMNGEAFEGGKGENYNLTIGSGSFIPGFEEQIIGHTKDEEFTINVTFPEDYQVDELAGQPAEFKIKLHEIKTRILPDLDDDFVQDVSEASTVEEYKAEIAKNLEEDLKKERDADIENKLVDVLVEKVEGEIPQAMYENKIDDMIREFDMRVRAQGLDLETYMQYAGLSQDDLRAQYEDEAEKRVKIRLALEKIAEIENIEADDEALEEEYSKIAEQYKMELDQVKSLIPASELKKDVAVSKAMDFVKENANIK